MTAATCLKNARACTMTNSARQISHRMTQQRPSLWPSQLVHQHRLNCYLLAARCPLRQLTAIQASAAANTKAAAALMTCKRCKQQFVAQDNSSTSCSYHPALYSGGEVAKAIGFVRASDAPEDQLERVVGRKGLLRFWDCCGAEDEGSPGCMTGFHVSFDDDLNAAKGWQ